MAMVCGSVGCAAVVRISPQKARAGATQNLVVRALILVRDSVFTATCLNCLVQCAVKDDKLFGELPSMRAILRVYNHHPETPSFVPP